MYRKILVGYDDSEQARDALALGRQLGDAAGADLVVAGVFPWDPIWRSASSSFRDADIAFAAKIEDAARRVGAEPEAVPGSSPAHGLHDLAEEIGADLILVGSARHGRIGRIVAGTTGMSLLHGSPCAVGIAPRGHRSRVREGIRRVAVGFDGSLEAGQALMAATGLAAATGATLNLMSVAGAPREREMRDWLAEASHAVPDGIEVEATLVRGDPVEELTSAGEAPGTVMVVGSRAYGPLRRVLLGSVAAHLVRSAPCPLIVTPRGMHEGNRREPAAAAETSP
jgi:nucleotide-binding universal stress UspA family protein